MQAGRRIDDPPLPGVENMARDLALLETRSTPTLRLYRWLRPTLSLGWFQDGAGLPLEAVRARGGEIVRRPSGGKAILHEHELTYSLCAPEVGPLSGGPEAATRFLHETMARELSQQAGRPVTLRGDAVLASELPGSPWCFLDSCELDLVLDGRKLLGSAARRRRGWILFHGSLVLRAAAETPQTGEFGREPDLDALAAALAGAMACPFDPKPWEQEELETARAVRDSGILEPKKRNFPALGRVS